MEALTSDITQLADRVKKLQEQLEQASTDVQKQFTEFLKVARKEVALIQEDINEVESVREELADYFAEDPKTFKLEECFSIMRYKIVCYFLLTLSVSLVLISFVILLFCLQDFLRAI